MSFFFPSFVYASSGYYYGPMTGQVVIPGQYVAIKGEINAWYARSIFKYDEERIRKIIESHGKSEDPFLKEAVDSLYSEDENSKILDARLDQNLARGVDMVRMNAIKPGPYQWLWFQAGAQSGLVVVERMPRTIDQVDAQSELLNYFYHNLRVLTYHPENPEVRWWKEFRPRPDGAILEIRILFQDAEVNKMEDEVFKDLLKTLNSYFKTMSTENKFPAPWNAIDSDANTPGMTLCYTAHPQVRKVLENAGFQAASTSLFTQYIASQVRNEVDRPIFYFPYDNRSPTLTADENLAVLLNDYK